MKSIIIRKPKFMRNDMLMKDYFNIATTISNSINTDVMTADEQYWMLKKTGECLNKAAKAGGFFRTKDMFKWLDEQETHIKKRERS